MNGIMKLTTIVLLFGLSSQARAGLLLEPYLGYEIGSTMKLESVGTGVDQGGKTTGLDLGLRAGYKLPLMLWFAADYSMMSGGTFKGEQSSNDGKVDRSDLYLDVGVDLPILARVWLGYGVMNSSKAKLDAGGDTTVKDGNNLKFGVGFSLIPLLSLNVEYFTHDYKKYEASGTGYSLSGSASDLWSTHTETGVMIGVSAPFNL